MQDSSLPALGQGAAVVLGFARDLEMRGGRSPTRTCWPAHQAAYAWRCFLPGSGGVHTAANTMLGRLEQANAGLKAIREAVAPAVPGPAKSTDTDSAAQEH